MLFINATVFFAITTLVATYLFALLGIDYIQYGSGLHPVISFPLSLLSLYLCLKSPSLYRYLTDIQKDFQ